MIEYKNEDLSKHTTVRIGGTAKRFLVPESTQELLDVVRTEKPRYFIGGGSNLLINDREFDLVVSMKAFDDSVETEEPGVYRVGASARLQKVINQINEDGYGGIEYLCNVPGLIGGAVAMNAGTGRKQGKAISDHIVSVQVIRDGQLTEMTKEECEFSYRDSYFKMHPDCLITSVCFSFQPMSREESTQAKEKKMQYYREKQDSSRPNFGSVFRQSDYKLMVLAQKLKFGKRVRFSGKTVNWILNVDHGSFDDAVKTIEKAEKLHKTFGKEIKREVILWE